MKKLRLFLLTGFCALALSGAFVTSDATAGRQHVGAIHIASQRDSATMRATDQGQPWVNLSNAHDLLTNYIGSAGLRC